MSTVARIWLSLAAFLVVGGIVYGITSHELAGAPLLLVGAATFCYLGLVAVRAVRTASRAEREGLESVDASTEPHVDPTIWPVGFSLAAVGLALGLVVNRWLLAVGGFLFVLSALGWYRAIARQRRHG